MKLETYIVLSTDKKFLESIEGDMFESEVDFLKKHHRRNGKIDEYYPISEFTELVNNEILDNLTTTFIGYVYVAKTKQQNSI